MKVFDVVSSGDGSKCTPCTLLDIGQVMTVTSSPWDAFAGLTARSENPAGKAKHTQARVPSENNITSLLRIATLKRCGWAYHWLLLPIASYDFRSGPGLSLLSSTLLSTYVRHVGWSAHTKLVELQLHIHTVFAADVVSCFAGDSKLILQSAGQLPSQLNTAQQSNPGKEEQHFLASGAFLRLSYAGPLSFYAVDNFVCLSACALSMLCAGRPCHCICVITKRTRNF